MIKTKLINQVKESRCYIALTVLAQWVKLLANIGMVAAMAGLLRLLFQGVDIPVRALLSLAAIGVASAAVRYGSSMLAVRCSFAASANVKKSLRQQLYRKLTRLGASYHEKVSTSELIQVFVEGVDQLEIYFGKYLPQFFYSLLAPVTLFAVLSFVSLRAAVLLLVCVPLIPLSIVAVQKIAKRLLRNYWGKYTDLGDTFLENIQGLTTLKIYQADEEKHRVMNEKAEAFRRITMRVLTMQLNSVTVMDIIAYGGSAAGVMVAVSEVLGGQIEVWQAFLIIMLAADFFLPLRALGSFFHVAMNGMAASDKMFRILDLEEPQPGSRTLTGEEPSLTLKNVSFSYDGEREVLRDVTLSVPRGGFAAIVGESGCGKSTLAAIVSGTLRGYRGSVRIGSREVSEVREESLTGYLTSVSCNSYLFAGTVADNLRMAAPNASDKQLEQSLRQVKLWDFLQTQQGLKTLLQPQGANFSGGQRQRLALARAMLHDTPMVIFDEATSNIDPESEGDIMDVIQQAAGKKTVLMITHRLENAVRADRIFVMEKGRLVESGTHHALCAAGGLYADMYRTQRELEKFARRGEEMA